MKKPTPVTNITIQGNNITPEQAQRMMQAIRERSEKEQREYKIYQKGVRDGSSGLVICGIRIF